MKTVRLICAALLLAVPMLVNAQWKYSTEKDTMRNSVWRFATVQSPVAVRLGFPYQGGTSMQILVRKHGDEGFSVILMINRGQLPCFSGCEVAVKFDDDEVKNWPGSGSSGGHTEAIFIRDAADFLDRLKASKRATVEVEIYGHGPVQFTFNTRGLKWDY